MTKSYIYTVVYKYNHLDSDTTISGSKVLDAKLRASLALSAYAPLAIQLFGAYFPGAWLKIRKAFQPLRIINAVHVRATSMFVQTLHHSCSFNA